MVFVFTFNDIVNNIDLHMPNLTWILRMEHFFLPYYLSNMFLNSVYSNLLKIFVVIFTREITLQFSFPLYLFSFGIKIIMISW